MSLRLVTQEHLAGLKNPALLHVILFSEDWNAEHQGKPCCCLRGWYIDRFTGKRVEASPRYVSRYAERKVMIEARNKMRAELGAV